MKNWFTHSVFLCFVSAANTNIVMEAIQHTTMTILFTICSPSDSALYSPQVGLQMLVLFSSKKKPSEHCSADVELLSRLNGRVESLRSVVEIPVSFRMGL